MVHCSIPYSCISSANSSWDGLYSSLQAQRVLGRRRFLLLALEQLLVLLEGIFGGNRAMTGMGVAVHGEAQFGGVRQGLQHGIHVAGVAQIRHGTRHGAFVVRHDGDDDGDGELTIMSETNDMCRVGKKKCADAQSEIYRDSMERNKKVWTNIICTHRKQEEDWLTWEARSYGELSR